MLICLYTYLAMLVMAAAAPLAPTPANAGSPLSPLGMTDASNSSNTPDASDVSSFDCAGTIVERAPGKRPNRCRDSAAHQTPQGVDRQLQHRGPRRLTAIIRHADHVSTSRPRI